MTTTVQRVLALAADTHRLALNSKREDLGQLLSDQERRWSESTTTVVLAGAQKRGKSSLLNVLIGKPGLLPVDADIATDTHVVIGHGERLSITVRREGPDGEADLSIEPTDLVHYASVLGDPARRRGVLGLDITIDRPLLQGVRLVDTPGVDSLTLGHRHATMAALTRADALLFAVSAQDQPILRHELEFVAEAAARIHSIAFVLTMAENSTSADALEAENKERLSRFVEQAATDHNDVHPDVARRLLAAPWIAVSAKLGEAAIRLRESGQSERADLRRRRSGLDPLEAHIRRCAGRRELVRAGGVLALTLSTLRGLETIGRDEAIGSGDDDDAVEARHADVQAAIEELNGRLRQRKLRSIDHQFLGRESTYRVRARLENYRRTYEREIDELSSAKAISQYVDELPNSVDRSLAAAWSEIVIETERLASEAIGGYLAEMGLDPSQMDIDALAQPSRGGRPITATVTEGRFDLLTEGVPALMMAGGVSYLASFAGASLLSPLAPIAIGAALASTVLMRRRKLAAAARERSALVVALRDVFAVAANDLCLAVERAVTTWRATADDAVEQAFAGQKRDLEQRRRDLTKLAEQDKTERARTAMHAKRQLAAVAALRERSVGLGLGLEAALRNQDSPGVQRAASAD